MAKRYIITLMAANRVGILAAVGTALDELDGNVHEVSQTVMQNFFTIILAADFPEDRPREVIVNHIRDVCRPFRIEVCLKDPEQETLQQEPSEEMDRFFLTVEGEDRPGVMRRISGRLAEEEIDITDLYGFRNDQTGSFLMVMELAVPRGADALQLQSDLEQLGKEIGLSATLQHQNIFDATNDPRPVRLASYLASSTNA